VRLFRRCGTLRPKAAARVDGGVSWARAECTCGCAHTRACSAFLAHALRALNLYLVHIGPGSAARRSSSGTQWGGAGAGAVAGAGGGDEEGEVAGGEIGGKENEERSRIASRSGRT
jgi:hypothetical protein